MSASYVSDTAPKTFIVPQGRFIVGILSISFIVFFVFLSISRISSPPVVAASAPSTEFSAARAMQYVETIGARPHPIGSSEHARVREYIEDELTVLGLNPEVQVTSVVVQTAGRRIQAGTVYNVMARLKGTGDGKAVMLMGHYDSVPTSLGASDDGAAVATMLETLRALRAGPGLKNDVIALFTDGEEMGLLGAKAFVDEHPWAKDVGLVLNFEARGTQGPSLMFETSADNGWLIDQLAHSAPWTVTSSLFFEIYKLLPNGTDFSVLKEAGYSGLNFAYTDGYAHYHTLSDNVENIDQRSLQHQGLYALTLTRSLGNANLEHTKARNEVYFSIPGLALIHYSERWVIPMAIMVLLLLAGVLYLGLRRKQLSISGIVLGFLTLFAILLAASVVVTIANLIVRNVHSEYRLILQGTTYNNQLYVIAFVSLTIGVALALNNWFRRKISTPNLMAGGLLWWAILMGVTSWWVPGASYLFTWPVLFSLIALGIMFGLPADATRSAKSLAIFSLCAIPGIVLLAPIIYLLSLGLSLSLFRAVLVLIVLLFALLLPQLEFVAVANKWVLPAMALLIGLIFIVEGHRTTRFTKNDPKPTDLFYALNGNSGKAVWASSNPPDEWTAQFFPEGSERSPIPEYLSFPRPFLHASAPSVELALPLLSAFSDVTENGLRTITMNIRSQRQAPIISVSVESDTEVTGATINGKHIVPQVSTIQPALQVPGPQMGGRMGEMRRPPWGFSYYAPPEGGIDLALETKSREGVRIRVMEQSFGLPESLLKALNPKPDYMMPTPYPFSPYADSTLVSKYFSLGVTGEKPGNFPSNGPVIKLQ
jgi:hypothetical protein